MLLTLPDICRQLGRVALAAACAGAFVAPAQAGLRDYPLRVEKIKGDRHLELVVHNQGPATMTVYLTIAGENVASDVVWPVTRAVPAFSSVPLGKVFPADGKKDSSLSYTVSKQYGDYRAVHTPDAQYRLPYQDGEAHRVTQAYGDPLTTHVGHHTQHAVDFAMPEGAAVVATRDGVVVDVTLDYDRSGMFIDLKDKANSVAIEHGDGTVAYYAHLSKRASPVSVGQRVTAGTVIAYAGDTGYSSGAHLHYAVMKPAVLADGRVANVALPVKFYVDTWTLPFEPRRGMNVTASYSRDAAMRAEKPPAQAGQRLSPEPAPVSVIPVRALRETATGQSASAPEREPLPTVTSVPVPQPAPLPRETASPPPVVQAAQASPPQAAQPAANEHPTTDPAMPGPLEAALIFAGAAFALLIPAVFWRRIRG